MSDTLRAAITVAGRRYDIEHAWIGPERREAPLLVFLHEGLGSVSMWRDYPRQLCDAGGYRGLLYSRPGYGRSTPRPLDEPLTPGFMHAQAREVLPALLAALGIDAARDQPWLFGHSDGGSIALLHAASFPDRVRGAIVLAPHLFVEDLSVDSIAKAREAYLHTSGPDTVSRSVGAGGATAPAPAPTAAGPSAGVPLRHSGVNPPDTVSPAHLRARLSRHHDDVDSAFWGWNDIWLAPAFRGWNIERELADIRCPVLAVQGVDDEYGTMAQIEAIARIVPDTELLRLPACGHSPHRDQPRVLTEAVLRFIRAQG